MRTFIAIELDDAVRKQLRNLQEKLRPHCGKLRWVDPNHIHLTLKFLGEIPDARVPSVSEAMQQLAREFGPFDIGIRKTGTFPPHQSIKVVWVGIEDPAGGLAKYQARCEDLLAALGFPKERRRFSPHLTLARNRDPAGSAAIRAALDHEPPFDAGIQTVTGATFYQSTLTPRGPIYNALSKHALGA
ncbi:MAG: RNA 2',3'-cyclic phosphodiesterase [Planctomycetota bacterium]